MHKGLGTEEHNANPSVPAGCWAVGLVRTGGAYIWATEEGRGRNVPSCGITPGSDRELVTG